MKPWQYRELITGKKKKKKKKKNLKNMNSTRVNTLKMIDLLQFPETKTASGVLLSASPCMTE
jgi:hypothetical protein